MASRRYTLECMLPILQPWVATTHAYMCAGDAPCGGKGYPRERPANQHKARHQQFPADLEAVLTVDPEASACAGRMNGHYNMGQK